MGRRWGALRAAARIARRDARRARGRTVLVAVLVGLPVFAGTAGGVLLASMEPGDATYARFELGEADAGEAVVQARVEPYLGPGLEQSIRGHGASWDGSPVEGPGVSEHERALAAVLPDGDRLLRVVRAIAGFSTPDRRVPSTTDVVSLPDDGDLSGVFPVADGVLPRAAHEVALSAATADRLGAALGDTVTMELDGHDGRPMTVVGMLAERPSAPRVVAGPGAVPLPESAAAEVGFATSHVTVEWYVVGPEPVTWDDVLEANEIGSVVVSRAVLDDPPPADQVPYGSGGPAAPDAGTVALYAGIAAVIVLEAVLLIGPAFAVGARRSERQLALLAASGAERRTLRHVVLLTGVVTGLVAAVGGVVVGLATAAGFRAVLRAFWEPFAFPDLRVPWLVLAGFAVLGTVVATLAAWLPARRAARVDVVAALAGRRPPVRHGRRLAVVGAVVAGLGLAAAVGGAVLTQPMVLVAGVVALELGLVAAVGALVGAVALLAPRLGAVGRIALRDASRNRSRTAPAVAAVLAGVAGVTAGAVYLQSGQEYNARGYSPFGAVGTVAVNVPTAELMDDDDLAERLGEMAAELEEHLPTTAVHPVSLAVAADAPEGADGGDSWFTLQPPPEKQCRLFGPEADTMTAAEREAEARDGRCREAGGSGLVAWMTASGATTLVDDGTVVRTLGFEESDPAARVLAEGHALVSSDLVVWDGGTVRFTVERHDPGGEGTVAGPAVDVPAEVVRLSGVQYDLVLPPDLLGELGLEAQPTGLVAAVSRPPTPAEEAAARSALGTDAQLAVERGNPFGRPGIELLLLVGAAVVVGLAATGISIALAAAESRPDLATLAAVGAAPRTRRRFMAAQAGVISGIGTSLGVLAGLALGWVLVMAERYRWEIPDYDRVLAVPWEAVAGIAVGVPLLAMAVGYVATRSRLPVVRRVAG